MAKSKLEKQLDAALEAGDLEQAREIRKQMTSPPPAPARKAARKGSQPSPAGRKRANRSSQSSDGETCPAAVAAPSPPAVIPKLEWLAQSRPEDSGGSGKRYGRKESMAGMPHHNTFKDNGRGGLDSKQRSIERQLAEQPISSRPGQGGAARAPASKVRVNCDGCGREFIVYPSEVQAVFDDNGRPYHYFKCDRCIIRGK